MFPKQESLHPNVDHHTIMMIFARQNTLIPILTSLRLPRTEGSRVRFIVLWWLCSLLPEPFLVPWCSISLVTDLVEDLGQVLRCFASAVGAPDDLHQKPLHSWLHTLLCRFEDHSSNSAASRSDSSYSTPSPRYPDLHRNVMGCWASSFAIGAHSLFHACLLMCVTVCYILGIAGRGFPFTSLPCTSGYKRLACTTVSNPNSNR